MAILSLAGCAPAEWEGSGSGSGIWSAKELSSSWRAEVRHCIRDVFKLDESLVEGDS
jgi:hypothetical protein